MIGKSRHKNQDGPPSPRQAGPKPTGLPGTGIAFILCVTCWCGCVSTVRLPIHTIPTTSSGSQIDASAALSKCAVVPSTSGFMGKTSLSASHLRPGTWYGTGWSTVCLDSVPADVAAVLEKSRLFVRGFSVNDPAADLQMELTVNLGCATSGGSSALTMLLIVGTLDVWPFIGGPFPTAAKAELVCEIFPPGARSESRVYKSKITLDGWAPMYTITKKENDLATRALSAAVKNVVDQIIRDRQPLNQVAQASQLRRTSRPADVPRPAGREPELVALPPATWPLDNIAVADLTTYTLSPGEAKTLSETLHSALVDTRYFRVLSRSDMRAVLEAQMFSRSDVCDDSACLVEMGKILSVVRIVGGSLGKVGSTFSLSLRVVNVETGETEVTVNRQLKSESDQLLLLVGQAARELALKYSTTRKTP